MSSYKQKSKNKPAEKLSYSTVMEMLGVQEGVLYGNTASSAFLGWPLSPWHESQPKALLAQKLPYLPLQDEMPMGTWCHC